MNPYDAVMPAPWGSIGVRVTGYAVSEIVYLSASTRLRQARDPLAAEAVRQLMAYLADPQHRFDLPLAPAGTAFRQRVWKEIAAVPLGSTTSYGAIAARLKSAARAVGQACGDNPYPIVIPCHRVVSRIGLGGFAHDPESEDGFHSSVKRWLLAHEGARL